MAKKPMIAKRLKALKERLGFTTKQLADHLGVSQHTMRAWLYGQREPSGMALRLIECIEKVSR